jgi:hypothetical protein
MFDFYLYGEPSLGMASTSRSEFSDELSLVPRQDVVNKSRRRNENVATK